MAEWTKYQQAERRRTTPSGMLSWGTPDLELLVPASREEGWRADVGEPLSRVPLLLFLLSELHSGSCKKNAEPLVTALRGRHSDVFHLLEGQVSLLLATQ